ncbi:MAG: rod shape-determining protein [Ruminococcaceae bacterium]|nr:rod shape-determining protein [Oscillospiraceae bacterium]
MLRKGIGIDVGSTQITICSLESGILLKEPSAVAVDVDNDEILGVGTAAVKMVQESPERLRLYWPIWDHVEKQERMVTVMLKTFLRRALGRTLLRPQVMLSIPCDLTEATTSAIEDAMLAAGASRVHLLEAPLCAALGAGLDFASPVGQMLVHVGASRTEAAMIFIGDMVTHLTVPVGGAQFDSAIIRYLRDKHRVYIGKRTAEQIKMRIGNVSGDHEEKKLDVKGRSVDDRTPRVVSLSSKEMLGAMRDPISEVLDAVVSVVEQTGEDMRADIAKGGIVLTGGAVLPGMDQFLADVLGLRARTATNADTAAAEGAALALERLSNT